MKRFSAIECSQIVSCWGICLIFAEKMPFLGKTRQETNYEQCRQLTKIIKNAPNFFFISLQ